MFETSIFAAGTTVLPGPFGWSVLSVFMAVMFLMVLLASLIISVMFFMAAMAC